MKKILVSVLLFLVTLTSMAQGVKIGIAQGEPDESAILDLESESKGMLPPRMTTAQRNAIVNPALGLHIFNTTTNCVNIFVGSSWKQVCGDCDFNSPVVGNNGPICEGSTLNLSATTILGATYLWSGPNGFTSTEQNPSIPDVTAAASGSYSLSATLNGCTSQLQNTVATVNSTPVTPTASNNGPICAGESLNLTAAVIVGASYAWTGPNSYTANTQNPLVSSNAQASHSGVYSVIATVNGCASAGGSTTVTVNSLPAATFTPLAAITGFAKTFVPAVSGATYSWTFTNGAPSTSTAENPSITWSLSGTYNVGLQVTLANGCSASGAVNVTVSDPVIQTYSYSGTIENFTVPGGVNTLIIEAWGAEGGGPGGTATQGARMKGVFNVTPGANLKILVGKAATGSLAGGGGSFVTLIDNSPLLIAGGGGSMTSGSCSESETQGRITTSGGTCGSATRADNGNGGFAMNSTSGSGGGLLGNGVNAGKGYAFVNGGAGGNGGESSYLGGFGGGGARGGSFGEGAGGGYSGGSCGDEPSAWVGCGGGGSYNGGTNQSNSPGVRAGNGLVTITY